MFRNGLVYTDIPRTVPQDIVDELARLGVATVHEAMGKLNLADPAVQLRCPGMRCAGPAITVSMRAADNLLIHKATTLARPGDVLVVDACGYTKGGLWGEMLSHVAKAVGLRGVFLDGAVRDLEQIRQVGVPVWSRAVHAGGTDKNAVGTVNVPIVFAGTQVNPGDIVVGDADGVVVVPAARAKEVMELSQARERKEKGMKSAIASGKTLYELMGLAPAFQALNLTEVQGTYRDREL